MDLSTGPHNDDSLAHECTNEVRRRDLVMDEAGIEALLQRGFCSRLATVGIDGAPYCTTLLYVWMDGRIHMHGTGARGHLRANIEHEARACFAIDEPGEVFDYAASNAIRRCPTPASWPSAA